MKIFQHKSFYIYIENILLKIILLSILLWAGIVDLNAQKASDIKLKVEAGLNRKPAEKEADLWGLLFSVEPRLKTSEKTFIGLRIQANENDQINEMYKSPSFFMANNLNRNLSGATSGTLLSFVPTFDYYFGENNFNPYIGAGIGLYMLTPPLKFLQPSTSSGALETKIDHQVGFLIRSGVDIGKLTLGLEFNYLPTADIKTLSGLVIGTVNDSFIGLAIGYSFGIRKGLK